MITRECFYCEDGIVHAGLLGVVRYQAWSNIFCKTLALAGIHRTRELLIDLRDAEFPSDTMGIYRLPSALKYIGLSRLYRMALVVSSMDRDKKFYETVFLNRGFKMRVFTGLDEARQWLKSGRDTGKQRADGNNLSDITPDQLNKHRAI